MREAIDIQEEAFRLLGTGAAVEGLRAVARSEAPPGVAIFNPAFLRGGRGFGIKVVSDFYGNPQRGVPRMSALIALFDGETGLPRTVMEGGYVTDLRTGAATALAARHLARRESRALAVIGAGRVARYQVQALATEFSLHSIQVATRSRARGEAFVASLELEAQLTEDVEGAVRDADLVVAATTSREPVVQGRWLKPGAFVAAVGAYAAQSRELDDECIVRAACHVVDSRADVLERAGDFLIPIGKGLLVRESIAELAEILTRARAGRRSPEDIVVFKSGGVPIQDLVTAQHVERRAIERGLGLLVDLGGEHD